METERRKIGYKNYDNNNVPKEVEKEEKNIDMQMEISPAQADLIESIQNLVEIISSKDFSSVYDENRRITFVKQLITFTALNSELTSKNKLAFSKIKTLTFV